MTKADLVGIIADKSQMTKKDSEVALNAVIDAITDSVVKGEKVALVGFGSFEARDRAAKVCKNPRTGETINVAATKVPVFKAGKSLKDAVASK